jgi:hypothetical protein
MRPRAAAGAPNVAVSRLGSRAVGISWPTSARKLAAPMPRTPGMSQRSCGWVVGSLMAAVLSSETTSRHSRAGLDLGVCSRGQGVTLPLKPRMPVG